MTSRLGKILRILRINAGDNMRDMANKLDLSISYLSAIENGKRNVPANFEEKIIKNYNLSEEERNNLREAISFSMEKIKVDVSDISDKKRKLIYSLSKDEISDDTIDELCALIKKKGK